MGLVHRLIIITSSIAIFLSNCQTISLEEITKAEKDIKSLKEEGAENLLTDEFKNLDTLLQKLKFEYERGQKRKAQSTLKEIEIRISLIKEKLQKLKQSSHSQMESLPSVTQVPPLPPPSLEP